MTTTLMIARYAAAICTCMLAGIFFVFSNFVMAGLGRLPADEGAAAMRSINVTAVNPLFMTLLLGTGLLVLILAGLALRNASAFDTGLIIFASALYLVGCIGVTMACNVPLNNALASASPDAPGAAAFWQHYLSSWTMWNHVRTVSALASAIAFMIAAWN